MAMFSLFPEQQKQEQMGLTMPEFGASKPAAAPSLGVDTNLASEMKPESSASMGEMGKAGVQGAAVLLSNLMQARAMREKEMRARKEQAAKGVAESTQKALQTQQEGMSNPLTQLIAAYR